MPIDTSSLHWRYTGAATGAANNTLSVGGTVSATSITSALANNIFDDVTGDEAAGTVNEYRCIGIWNNYPAGSYTWMNTSIRVSGYLRSASSWDTMYIATEKPQGAGTGTIQTIRRSQAYALHRHVHFSSLQSPVCPVLQFRIRRMEDGEKVGTLTLL